MAVKFSQHMDIDAPPDVVWQLLNDSTKWPLWFHGMEQVTGLGSLAQNASFQWQKGSETGTGSVLRADNEQYVLIFATRAGNDERKHSFDIDRSGGFFGMGGNDSRLKYTLEYDPPGGMIGDFVAGGNPADALAVKNSLGKIRDMAESMAKGR